MINHVDFTVVLRGYDMAVVDAVVRSIQHALASDDPAVRAAARDDLRDMTIRVRFRGYDRVQVDDYLRQSAARL